MQRFSAAIWIINNLMHERYRRGHISTTSKPASKNVLDSTAALTAKDISRLVVDASPFHCFNHVSMTYNATRRPYASLSDTVAPGR